MSERPPNEERATPEVDRDGGGLLQIEFPEQHDAHHQPALTRRGRSTDEPRRPPASTSQLLLRRGLALEYATLGWNVVGVVVLAITAIAAGSVALAAFGIDSLIEILASMTVVWQLKGTDTTSRTVPALRAIAIAFAALAVYILIQSSIVLANGSHPGRSIVGSAWLAITALVMFALARGKADTGRRLDNAVLRTEARITVIDGALATIILLGVLLNTALHWSWADPIAALVLAVYAIREARHAWSEAAQSDG